MSNGIIRRKVQFSGRMNVHNEEESGQTFMINDEIIQVVDQKIHENRYFRIFNLALVIPQVTYTISCEIVDSDLFL